MKKEFSYYEFVGLIIPGILLMYFGNYMIKDQLGIEVFDTGSVGDSVFLMVIGYALGHFIQALGNYIEGIIWYLYGGIPTTWLMKPKLQQRLLSTLEAERLKNKLTLYFKKYEDRDYGRDVYNILFIKGLTSRIDIFNANYSLFRGLTVSLLILAILASLYYNWCLGIGILGLSFLATQRMIRFGIYYAKEVYQTFLNVESHNHKP